MTDTPCFDDFYTEKTTWARDQLFAALEELGVSPGTNDTLTETDELVPYLPKLDGSSQPPKIVPVDVIPQPGVGARMYVTTKTSVVTLDDDYLKPASILHPLPIPSQHFTAYQFIAPGRGSHASYFSALIKGDVSTGQFDNKCNMKTIDISGHPRDEATDVGEEFAYQVPVLYTAKSLDPNDPWIYATAYNSTQFCFQKISNLATAQGWSQEGLNGDEGGIFIVSKWDNETNRTAYIVTYQTNWHNQDQRKISAGRIHRMSLSGGTGQSMLSAKFNQQPFIKISEVTGRNETPSALGLNNDRLMVAFPLSNFVSLHELANSDSPEKIFFDGSPVGLAATDDLLMVAYRSESGGFVVEVMRLDDLAADLVAVLKFEGEFRSMALSSDAAVLYVAHQSPKGGRVGLFDVTEPTKPKRSRFIREFVVKEPVDLMLARSPGIVGV